MCRALLIIVGWDIVEWIRTKSSEENEVEERLSWVQDVAQLPFWVGFWPNRTVWETKPRRWSGRLTKTGLDWPPKLLIHLVLPQLGSARLIWPTYPWQHYFKLRTPRAPQTCQLDRLSINIDHPLHRASSTSTIDHPLHRHRSSSTSTSTILYTAAFSSFTYELATRRIPYPAISLFYFIHGLSSY